MNILRLACLGVLALSGWAADANKIDPVLLQLLPNDSTSLFGARMDELKSTPLYQKMIAKQKLPQLDDFAKETGFDPRRDVRELVIASNGKVAVLAARGTFHLTDITKLNNFKNGKTGNVRRTNYNGYNIVHSPDAGFCLLDSTTAVAGNLGAVHAALDAYKAGDHSPLIALLSKAKAIPSQYQAWEVSLGGADFLADNMPKTGAFGGFSKIFRSLEGTLLQADMRNGLNAIAQGNCKTDQDAKSLADAARGLIGFGRLSVPENQPELLKLWDGIQVEQRQKQITIDADVPQNLIDKLVDMLQTGGPAANVRRRSAGSSGAGSRSPESTRPPR